MSTKFGKFLITAGITTVLIMNSHSLPAEERHTYLQSSGDRRDIIKWRLLSRGNDLNIEAFNGKDRYSTICTADGMTREWTYKNQEDVIHIRREKNLLRFSGMQNGIVLENTLQIDEDPWFQALSYSLREFTTSARHSMRFWLVRQDTMEPVKLSADKVAKEKKSLCNGAPAVPVEIRPVGLMSPFWHATYWFRKDDNVFCRYEGRHGAWGTPLTTISLEKTGF